MTLTEHTARITRNTSLMIGASIAQKVLTFFYFVFIARVYGVAQTGQYFFALSFSMILSVIADFGFSPLLIRETAQSPGDGGQKLRVMLGGKFILMLIAYLVLAAAAFIFVSDQLVRTYVLMAGVIMLIDSWNLTLYAVIRGFEKLSYESLGTILGQSVTFILGGVLIIMHAPVPWLFGALIAGSLFHLVWASAILVRRFSIIPLPLWNMTKFWSMLRLAIPFALAGIFVKVYSYADGVLLGILVDQKHVGWYSVAYKLTFAFQFIPMGFAASLYPAFSALATKTKEELQSTFTHASFILLLIALPISFGIFSLADRLIPAFYGTAYSTAVPALQILIFTTVFLFLSFPVGSLLNATHRQNVWTAIMGVSMVVNVALNLLLIPRYTLVGASIAALASQVLLVIAGLFVIHRVLTVDWHAWLQFTVKALIAVSFMTTIVIWLKPYLDYISLIILGAIVYSFALLVFRLLQWTQIVQFLRSIARKSV